jgi:SnoaL-like protein
MISIFKSNLHSAEVERGPGLRARPLGRRQCLRCSRSAIEVRGDRAIAQTKMTISQRALVHGVEVDVVCTGRFFDFFERRDGRWAIVRRQPIYERDRMDPVAPGASVTLDAATLNRFPYGYRHLGYLQSELGFDVRTGLSGLTGEAAGQLDSEGRAWLSGSGTPGTPV